MKTFKCKQIYQNKLDKISQELERRKNAKEKDKFRLSGLSSYAIEVQKVFDLILDFVF